jgi:tetratricopeptide (TPR) repeat protein
VQIRALSSPSRFADRAFWQRTIDRVRKLTGPDAQGWQIEQARYHILGNPSLQELEGDIQSLRKIVQASPELVDVHRLLAQAMLRTQKPEYVAQATAELTMAHDLQPDDFQSTAELTPLLASQGMIDKALILVDSVAATKSLPMDRQLWAARSYAELGKADAGIKLLTTDAPAQPDSNRDTILAQLYAHAGRTDEASSLYQRLLADPNATVEALGAGADFFANSRQSPLAAKFLERIKKLPMAPGTAELVQAHLDEVEGQFQPALQSLEQATKSNPKSRQAWLELSGFYLRFGKLDEAQKAAAQGLASVPGALDLSAMGQNIARIRSITARDIYPLVKVLSHTPQQPFAQQAIALLAVAKSRNDAPAQVLSDLSQLADQHPQFLPLQEVVVRRFLAASRFKEAAATASRSCEVAPYDIQSLQLLTTVEIAAKNWEGARVAGERWRKASGLETVDPDVNIALTYLEQPDADPQAALKQLASYMSDDAPAVARETALPAYCRALMASDRVDDAANLLFPLVAKSPKWAGVWFDLATLGAKDADTAINWLKRVEPSLASDAKLLRVAFVSAWEQVGQKFDSMRAHETAYAELKPIVANSPVPAAAWWQWAIVNQSLGILPEAQRGWEEYLKLNTGDAQGLNNLAYVLLLIGDPAQLPRARELVLQAITAYPNVSTFYDTLGRIESRAGKTTDAIKDFRLAVDKDPNDLDAMIGLADALQSQPAGRDEARALLGRINAIIDGGTPLTPPIRRQLDRVKSAITSSL